MSRKEQLAVIFAEEKRGHDLRLFTFTMFVFLVIEKALSTATAVYQKGEILFSFTLREIDVVSILIYLSMAVLIAFRVRYKYLLIPDFALLGVKVYSMISAASVLLGGEQNTLSRFSAVENLVESFLFSLFLLTLFAGKLLHTKHRFSKEYPFHCMRLLIFCFPITVLFEVVKIFIATELHQYPFVILFNFAKGVLNEAFLDLPYFLLVLLICFVPHRER